MARITVEDCLEHVENRFELVLTAAARARELAFGADSSLAWENDKPTVMALREVADDLLDSDGVPKAAVAETVDEVTVTDVQPSDADDQNQE